MRMDGSRALREGAMMAALTAVLIIMSWYVPLFSVVGIFACGVPMACLAARRGIRVTAVAAAAAYGVSVLAVGSLISPIAVMLMYVIPGAVAGHCLGKHRPFFASLFAVCLAVCIGWLAELLVIDRIIGGGGVAGMLGEMTEQLKKTVDAVAKALPAEAMNGIDPSELVKTLNDTFEYTLRLYFPSIVIVSSMATGYIIIRLSGFVIRRARLCEIETVSFSRIKAPASMTFVAVLLYLVLMFMKENTVLWSVLANAVFVLYTIVAFCGLSFVDSKLAKRLDTPAVRVLIYIMIFLLASFALSLIMNILVIIGILDSTHDYRRLGGGEPKA